MQSYGGPALIALLAALVALQAISTDLYLPSLPEIVRDLATTIESVQLTLSLFLLGFGTGQLLWGPLSDRFGRRPVLLVGLSLYTAASLACAFAPHIRSLIAARILQGFAAAAGPVLGRAIVRDLWGARESARLLSYLASAMAIAPMLGPILGGWLTSLLGWRANFLALALFGGLVLVATITKLNESHRKPDPHALKPTSLLTNYATVSQNPQFRWSALTAAFTYSGIFCFISGSAHVLIGLVGLSPPAYGTVFALAVSGYMIGGLLAGRLHARKPVARVLVFGARLAACACAIGFLLALSAPPTVASVVGPAFAFFLGAGIALPSAMAAAIAPFAERAGLASALLGALQLAVAALFGVLLAALYDQSARPMAGLWLTTALIALITAHRATSWHHRDRHQEQER